MRTLVDGQEILHARGVRQSGGCSLGFYVWTSVEIDNLKVYSIPAKVKPGAK